MVKLGKICAQIDTLCVIAWPCQHRNSIGAAEPSSYAPRASMLSVAERQKREADTTASPSKHSHDCVWPLVHQYTDAVPPNR